MNTLSLTKHPSSFRDTSGFIFQKQGVFYRQINSGYSKHYEHLVSSGLYNELVKKNFCYRMKK